ncbi:hypothetical protein ACFXAF_35845 [Kitasatospora sp. NPDC059463]|uniref:hypothetical protein n=1 Tax=unclassified Kitasatospora TaxID=2633591 RepID=UPI00368CD427
MAETRAVPGGPEPVPDAGPRNAYEEPPPGPAALYEPPPAPGPVPGPPEPSTGWTVTGMPSPAPFIAPGATPAHGLPGFGGLGGGPRGRILVVEGGYGTSGRRTWGRGGPTQAPVLSAMLAAVSPQVLLAADAVDAVHLPGASDPHTVLAHLRAAARHPGPLLVHLGGHLLADKRGGQLHLTLRDSKPGSIRQDGLAWQAIAAELRHRPADWQTLVIADLSADQNAWPLLQGAQGTVSPLGDGLPLWAVISPDPEQIGTFTRALIEALHGGRPGAEAVLAPEHLRQQVYSVLRPDVIVLTTHAPDRPVFRNTARRGEGPFADAPAAVLPRPAGAPEDAAWPDDRPWGEPPRDAVPGEAAPQDAVPRPVVTLDKPAAAPAVAAPVPDGPVSLLKPGMPPTPPLPPHPVDLVKPGAWQPPAPEPAAEPEPTPEPEHSEPRADYREVIGRIVRSADAGDHAAATDLAFALELEAIAEHGPVSAPVLQVRQVRAHVSRLAGRTAEAADLYREVALSLLRTQGAEHPETQHAATNAEACWRAIRDRAEALRIAPEIIELRAHLPGPDGRKLRAAERHLAALAAADRQETEPAPAS